MAGCAESSAWFLGVGGSTGEDSAHLGECSGPVPAAPLYRQLFPCQHLLVRNRTKAPKELSDGLNFVSLPSCPRI